MRFARGVAATHTSGREDSIILTRSLALWLALSLAPSPCRSFKLAFYFLSPAPLFFYVSLALSPLSPSLSLSPVAEGGGETGSQRSDATRSDTEIAEMRRGWFEESEIRNWGEGIGNQG